MIIFAHNRSLCSILEIVWTQSGPMHDAGLLGEPGMIAELLVPGTCLIGVHA